MTETWGTEIGYWTADFAETLMEGDSERVVMALRMLRTDIRERGTSPGMRTAVVTHAADGRATFFERWFDRELGEGLVFDRRINQPYLRAELTTAVHS